MKTEEGNCLFPIAINAVVLDCKDPAALSDFYIRLLGWEKEPENEDEEFVGIFSPNGSPRILFQRNENYIRPVWPEEPEKQQQMTHLDFTVASKNQMGLAVRHAVSCGASRTDVQYSDKWTVMIDPAGHPFCLVVWMDGLD
ncbi:MAG: VOC family protein [Oscillospiraceae bacterium]|nr:VOC family protein [Oscillospiraceae bacterium]MCI1991328.1 VOC family protein [Oscillospiraceae bacterium]MCI2035118.1 VOC family protein [Oscillospiraceae bacterium]